MSFEGLQERLKQLEDNAAQLQSLIRRLADLEFQPGSVPLSADADDNVAAELGAEIALGLREEGEELELLAEEVTDLRGGRAGWRAEHDKARLKEWVSRLEGELKTARLTFRKAQLSARASLLAAQRQERQLLLAPYADAPPSLSSSVASADDLAPTSPTTLRPPRRQHHRPARNQDPPASATVSASRDVTAAMRETHALLTSSVARSDFAARTLAESTAALEQLGDTYSDLGGMLQSSRLLLGNLLKTQKSDTWYLETALYLVLATAAWLVFRRLLYGPLWLMVWFPLRTVWRVGGSAVGMVGGGGSGGASMLVDEAGGRKGVVGMEEGSVPTVSVGRTTEGEKGKGGDRDSMVDQVGKIVDGEVDGEGSEDGPNPKKRMWEEERVKDEL